MVFGRGQCRGRDGSAPAAVGVPGLRAERPGQRGPEGGVEVIAGPGEDHDVVDVEPEAHHDASEAYALERRTQLPHAEPAHRHELPERQLQEEDGRAREYHRHHVWDQERACAQPYFDDILLVGYIVTMYLYFTVQYLLSTWTILC